MEKTLHSRRLWEMAAHYVLDGRCVKSRSCRPEIMDAKTIEKLVQDHANVIIQEGQEIKIYCDSDFIQMFNNMIEKGSNFKDVNNICEAYEEGRLELFVKYSKKKTIKEINVEIILFQNLRTLVS